MKDWKNTISNILGIVVVILGALVTASQTGLTMPTWVITICTAGIPVCVAIIAVLTGKNPDLSSKTENQLNNAEKLK